MMQAATVDAGPVTVAVTRIARAGSERDFEAALHEFVEGSLKEPGQLGVNVLRPPPGDTSRRYGILRRFDSEVTRDAFYASSAYADWERRVTALTEGAPTTERVSGLEAWFTAPGRPVVPPPRWKMATVTLLGVYPLSLVLPRLLRPLLSAVPHPLAALIVSACMVAALTWLVMPNLAKLLHGWLHPAPQASS